MSYLVLALKWRPQRFQDVTGQAHVSRTLSTALKTGRTAHAYLFCGPRGVGKTSMARILAKAVNCERGTGEEPCNQCDSCRDITTGRAIDVIEIDGASNRGIDDIRDLREGVRYSPAQLKSKVYIIDEVHMLTQDAFNALLKTLEEPPRHVVFVLATTEPLKVPATILSRCQRFDFARLRTVEAAARLAYICEQEGIAAEPEALALIARKGDGSMRDSLTLLDQVLAANVIPMTATSVRDSLGIAGRELYFAWTEAILNRDAKRVLQSLGDAIDEGANLQELADEFVGHLRNLLLVATDLSLAEMVEGTHEERELYAAQAARWNAIDLLRATRLGLDASLMMRRSGVPRVHLELLLAELAEMITALDLKRFLDATRGRTTDAPAAATFAPRVASTGPRGTAGPRAEESVRPAAGAVPPARESASLAPAEVGDAASGIAAVRAQLARSTGASAGRTKQPEPKAPSEEAPNPVAETPGSEPAAVTGPIEPAALAGPIEPAPGVGPERSGGGDGWERVVAKVSAQKPTLAAFLIGSELLAREGTSIRVGIPGLTKFHVEQLERGEHRRLIGAAIEAEFGPGLLIRYEAGGSGKGAGAPTPRSGRGEATGSSDPNSISPDQVRRIADLFDGDVIGPA